MSATQLLGLGDRMLAMTAEYVVERKQFGVPIGSFQAVKHHLANALLALEFARPVVYRAAQSLTTADPHASRDASMAKAEKRRVRSVHMYVLDFSLTTILIV